MRIICVLSKESNHENDLFKNKRGKLFDFLKQINDITVAYGKIETNLLIF